MSEAVRGDLVVVGDVHLDRGDPAVEEFCRFLDRIAARTARLVLAGDLFELWLGREETLEAHHRRVLEAFRSLRERGIVVRYVEGNRDYRVGEAAAAGALTDVAARPIFERHGGRSLVIAHGDLANVRDRRYRVWRRASRSWLAWVAFRAIPPSRRLGAARALEARLRRTNLEYKREFPEDAVRRYAAPWLAAGNDAVILGHFHVERDLAASGRGRILVLPEWKESRRHLRVDATGDVRFVDSPC